MMDFTKRWGHDRAIGHAGIFEEARADRDGTARIRRHRLFAATGAVKGGVPAVRVEIDKWRWEVFSAN